jgi:hypothetical protein
MKKSTTKNQIEGQLSDLIIPVVKKPVKARVKAKKIVQENMIESNIKIRPKPAVKLSKIESSSLVEINKPKTFLNSQRLDFLNLQVEILLKQRIRYKNFRLQFQLQTLPSLQTLFQPNFPPSPKYLLNPSSSPGSHSNAAPSILRSWTLKPITLSSSCTPKMV